MNNTIPNVPRELLERLAVPKPDAKGWTTWHSSTAYQAAKELRGFLDAPSPAGVDGLEVVTVRVCGYAPGLGQVTVQLPDGEYRNWSRRLELGEHVQVSVNQPDAQSIIDGLRGEVERLSSQKADWVDRATALGQKADQQAETIANYKSQFSELHAARNLLSRLSMAGFELSDDVATSVIAERDQQAQRLGELEGLLLEVHDTYRAAIHWEDLRGTMKRIDAAISAGKEGE